jgi:hypothetical protein
MNVLCGVVISCYVNYISIKLLIKKKKRTAPTTNGEAVGRKNPHTLLVGM